MPEFAWYLRRLSLMSVAEIGFRASRSLRSGFERRGMGLAQAARSQAVRDVDQGLPAIPAVATADVAGCLRAADSAARGVGRILGLEDAQFGPDFGWNRDPKTGVIAPLSFGKAIDYRNERVVGDIKYLWEPNRHLHLPTLAQAAILTGDQHYALEVQRHVSTWIEQCPYPNGPNWASALETGLRLINWSWTWRILGGGKALIHRWHWRPGAVARWLESIYEHQHFCSANYSAYSSANNHLLGEAAGAYVAAQTWPSWPESGSWRRRAKEILEAGCSEQIADDGVNREQTTSYQLFVFELLACAGIVGEQANDAFPALYWSRLCRMMDFVATLYSDKEGLPQIGDSDDALVVALAPDASERQVESDLYLAGILFEREDLRQLGARSQERGQWMVGDGAQPVFRAMDSRKVSRAGAQVEVQSFPQGGYHVVRSAVPGAPQMRLAFDTGPLGFLSIAAHGHADALSLLLWVDELEFLIDPGTYAYHTEPEWRAYFRGTAAHNTVTVDGVDQSLSGGNFMWLRHANAVCKMLRTGADGVVIAGEHDGYMRLKDPVKHGRTVNVRSDRPEILVTDEFRCKSEHETEMRWHFSKECRVELGEYGLTALRSGIRVEMRPEGGPWTASLLSGSTAPIGGWVARRFGVKCPCATVGWRFAVNGPTTIRTAIRVSRE